MYPVNIDWWIFQVRGYEGHWAFGILVLGYFLQRRNSLNAGYDREWFDSAWSTAILSGFFFARLFHFLFWDTKLFFSNPLVFFYPTGGFTILGGTIGTAFGAWAYCRYTKKDFLLWCDQLMIPLTLGLALSRFSCFLNGDAYGIPTASIFGVTFSENSDAWMAEWITLREQYAFSDNPLNFLSQHFINYINLIDIPIPDSVSYLKEKGFSNLAELASLYPPTADPATYKTKLIELGLFPFPVVYPKVHPTQIYESILVFVCLGVLLYYQKKIGTPKKLFFLYWLQYSLIRFVIEFFRGDKNIAFANLTYAQVICLAVFGVSATIFFFGKFSKAVEDRK